MYNEKITPNNIPVNVAIKPIKNPVRKKDFIIEFLESPRDEMVFYLLLDAVSYNTFS